MRIASRRVLVSAVLLAIVLSAQWLAVGFTARPAEAASGATIAQYRAWMAEAKKLYPYPQTLDKMYRVMMCESGGNAYASGGRGLWLGLYQYAPSTWRGRWNPYRYQSIWNAEAQIFATARAWSLGMQHAWSCYYYTPGR